MQSNRTQYLNAIIPFYFLLFSSGNGPSAIFLSLLLSGYKPFFTGSHPNKILQEKLRTDVSLLEQVREGVCVQ